MKISPVEGHKRNPTCEMLNPSNITMQWNLMWTWDIAFKLQFLEAFNVLAR